MAPIDLMTSQVTITPLEAGGSVDRLGRPVTTRGPSRVVSGRLVRHSSPDYQPVIDGRVVAVWRLFLPLGSLVSDTDEIVVDGRPLELISAPDDPASPLTGVGYVVLLVREVL